MSQFIKSGGEDPQGKARGFKTDETGIQLFKNTSAFKDYELITNVDISNNDSWQSGLINGGGQTIEMYIRFNRPIKFRIGLEHYSESGQFLFDEIVFDSRGLPIDRTNLSIPKRTHGTRFRLHNHENADVSITRFSVTEVN